MYQGIGKDVPRAQPTSSREIPAYKLYSSWVFMGCFHPQESLGLPGLPQ